jgi:hypothetical protein
MNHKLKQMINPQLWKNIYIILFLKDVRIYFTFGFFVELKVIEFGEILALNMPHPLLQRLAHFIGLAILFHKKTGNNFANSRKNVKNKKLLKNKNLKII